MAVRAVCVFACKSALGGVNWFCFAFLPQGHAEKLSQVEPDIVDRLEPWHVDSIKRVWSDQGTQRCYERRREFQLSDSAK